MESFVKTGDATYAAQKAGYPQPATVGGVLLRREPVQEAIRAQVLASAANGAAEGLTVLRAIANDVKAKASDRINAAGKVVTAYIRLQTTEGPEKELHELTADEIRDALKRVQIELSAIDVTPTEPVDQAPAPDMFE